MAQSFTEKLPTDFSQASEAPEFKWGLPFFGIPKHMVDGPYEFMMDGFRQCGPVFSFKIFGKKFICNMHPQWHKSYFEETDKKLTQKPAYFFIEEAFGSEVLVFAPFEEYIRQREIINPLFRGNILKGYLSAMTEQASNLLNKMGDDFVMDELTRTIGPMVLDIAAQSFLGRDFQKKLGRRYFELFIDLTGLIDFVIPYWVPLKRFVKGRAARKELNDTIDQWIAERRAHPIDPPDFFQELIGAKYPDGSQVPDNRLRSLILLLTWAGHETTTGQISWLLYDLINHPDYYEKCRQQIDEVLGDSDGRDMTMEQANSLTLLEFAAKESERLHPVGFIQMREATEDFVMGGVKVRKGNIVVLNPGVVGNMPEFFPRADVYNPMRFMRIEKDASQATTAADGCPHPDGAGATTTTCPFTGQDLEGFQNNDIPESLKLMGFGGGIHRCPGINFARMEMRVVTAMLIRNYDIQRLSDPGPSMFGMAYWPMNFKVRFVKRKR